MTDPNNDHIPTESKNDRETGARKYPSRSERSRPRQGNINHQRTETGDFEIDSSKKGHDLTEHISEAKEITGKRDDANAKQHK